ncbi:ABC transporter permease [Verrucomicrobiales bacterium BCK34]|nr:ABC transporter permease [Verrucomicrobiales bacterium BCK34]
MNPFKLAIRSLIHYRWINLSVLAGVALTSAILSGALVVGDSVKESLRRNAAARTAGVGPVLLGGERYFTDSLASRISSSTGIEGVVAGVIQVEGTALNREEGQRANKVQILGVDENFWKLSPAGEAPAGFDDENWVGINEPLKNRVETEVGETLIVRVELPGALSKDAPLSGESEQTTPFTIEVSDVLGPDHFGLYSLRAEQVPPSTIFVKLARLQQFLEQPGRANVILAGETVGAEKLEKAANSLWNLKDLQLTVEEIGPAKEKQLASSRVFFDDVIVSAVGEISEVESPVLTYLTTSISKGEKVTPYSMVAGVGAALNTIVDSDLGGDEIVVSDWLAEDLGLVTGDEVSLTYNVVGAGRVLEEKERSFRVAKVMPIGEQGWSQSWTPAFPGIFDVENLDEWEPGIPIDRDRIRDKDDEFWDEYRATPKAFVSLASAQEMWGNRFGEATAVRFLQENTGKPLEDSLRAHLQLGDLGMIVRDLPAESAEAVAHSFDFGALFASMSFFLIIAALVLAGLVFVFGIEQRASQIGLLLALGFTKKKVRGVFLIEALFLSVFGALSGLLLGYVYTRLALYGMSGVWKDAAAGIKFVYHLKPQTLLIAFFSTVIISIVVVYLASRRVSAIQPGFLIAGGDDVSGEKQSKWRWDWFSLIVGVAGGMGCLFAPKVEGTMAEQGLFFGAGFLFTVSGVAFCSLLIRRFMKPSAVMTSLGALGRQHTVRRRGRSLAVVGLMASGVFMVTAINSFRLNGESGAERRGAGTGGFAYFGESTLPVYEDLNSTEAWEKYGINDVEVDFSALSFRVSDGDDASCLNLNRAQRPRLLGVKTDSIAEINPFTFTKLADPDASKRPWKLLDRTIEVEDGKVPVIPGVIDQNTATYALQVGLGDRVSYETVSGSSFEVEIVGFLDTSVLQGSLTISEANFIRFFPDAGGYEMFLIDGESPEILEPLAAHLTRMFGDRGLEMNPTSQKLNEFNAVQNTYLSIFSTLGGLGIFLGTLGLAVIVSRNVLERKGQLGVMQAMGFTRNDLAGMVLSEHWFLHVSGVLVGFVAAMVAVWPILAKGPGSLPWLLLAGINGAILVGGLVFCGVAARIVLRGNLMEAIREE